MAATADFTAIGFGAGRFESYGSHDEETAFGTAESGRAARTPPRENEVSAGPKLDQRANEGRPMQWEYYRLATVEARLDEALHDLGVEGWELVSILPESRLFHGYQCFLKRSITDADPSRRHTTSITSRINKYLAPR